MSIASAITAAQGRVANAYTAVANKGGTLPATQNLSNLPAAINSIVTTPTINSLSITPTTSAQTITAPSGIDGYNPINVSAVTSSIDANIIAGNIKSGVTILGTTGTYGGGTELAGYEIYNNVISRRSGTLTGTEFSSATNIDDFGMYAAFYECSQLIGSVNMSQVASVGQEGLRLAFRYSGINGSVNLSSLTSVGRFGLQYAFAETDIISANLSSLIEITNQYALSNAFHNCYSLTTVDISDLETVSGGYALEWAFAGTGIVEIEFYSLKTISGNYCFQSIFSSCVYLTTVKFTTLTTISGSNAMYTAFSACDVLSNVTFPLLNTISGASAFYYTFRGCTALTSLTFSALSTLTGNNAFYYALYGCSALTDVYFPALTTTSFGSNINQFQNMMSNTGSSIVHNLHFPSNLQSTISGLTGYPTFGGTSGYVNCLFDLPATS